MVRILLLEESLLLKLAADTPATFTRYFRLSQREDAWITPKTLTQYLDHFRSFDRVETLTLSYFSCDAFDQASLLSLFQGQIPSVRKLRLHRPTACPTSLLRFTSIFENLRDTVIYAPCWTMASHQEDHLETPRTLRGDLHLVELDEDSDPFFFLLASQVTHYQQVVLERCALHNFRSFQSFVSNTGMSLRTLYIFVDGDRRFNIPIEIHTPIYTSSCSPKALLGGLHSPRKSYHKRR